MEKMRKIERSSTGVRSAQSAQPWASRWTSSPPWRMAVTAQGEAAVVDVAVGDAVDGVEAGPVEAPGGGSHGRQQ